MSLLSTCVAYALVSVCPPLCSEADISHPRNIHPSCIVLSWNRRSRNRLMGFPFAFIPLFRGLLLRHSGWIIFQWGSATCCDGDEAGKQQDDKS